MQEHVPLTPSVTLDPFVRWFLDTPTHQPLLVIDTFVRSGPGIRPVQADMGGLMAVGTRSTRSSHGTRLTSRRVVYSGHVGWVPVSPKRMRVGLPIDVRLGGHRGCASHGHPLALSLSARMDLHTLVPGRAVGMANPRADD